DTLRQALRLLSSEAIASEAAAIAGELRADAVVVDCLLASVAARMQRAAAPRPNSARREKTAEAIDRKSSFGEVLRSGPRQAFAHLSSQVTAERLPRAWSARGKLRRVGSAMVIGPPGRMLQASILAARDGGVNED